MTTLITGHRRLHRLPCRPPPARAWRYRDRIDNLNTYYDVGLKRDRLKEITVECQPGKAPRPGLVVREVHLEKVNRSPQFSFSDRVLRPTS